MTKPNTSNSLKLEPTSSHSPWYLRYVMLMAFLVVMVSLMDRYVVSILMEQIKAELSLTDTQLGWLVGPAFVVVHILSQLPLARLADKTRRVAMISLAMSLWSIFTMAAGFAKTFPVLLITRMGVGITEAASSPALASLLSDFFTAKRRGRAMSMLSVGGVAGIGAGMLLGGIVGQHYGWRTALIVAGIPGLLLSLLVWLTIKEPRRGASDQADDLSPDTLPDSQRSLMDVLRILLSNRTFIWLLIGASLSMVTSIGRGAWEPVFLIRVYELNQASAGMIYFLISPVPSMIGGFFGGLLLDHLVQKDRRWYLWFPAIAMLISMPFSIAFYLWPQHETFFNGSLPVGFIFSILGSVIGAMMGPAIIAAAQSLFDASMRAMTHAVWSMAANLIGMGLGPLAVGWLSETMSIEFGADSIRYAMTIVAGVALPATLALLIGARYIRKDFRQSDSSKQFSVETANG